MLSLMRKIRVIWLLIKMLIENRGFPIKPILAKIKLNPGKRSSPEIQRLQFPLALNSQETFQNSQLGRKGENM